MRKRPNLRRCATLIATCAVSAGCAVAHADDAADRARLRDLGLRPLSAYYVLDGEVALNKIMRDVGQLQKELADAQLQRSDVERQAALSTQLVVQYAQQRRVLRQRLARARSVRERNQIVTALNELGDRITVLSAQGEASQSLKTARTTAGQAQEKFAQQVIAIRRLVDQLKNRYATLAADPQVGAVIARGNASTGKSRRLGPTPTLVRNERLLKKIEARVLSESIPLRASRSGLMFVTATINGKQAIELAVDTGASIVLLPEETARKAGIRIPASGPTLQLQMADGRSVAAAQTRIPSLRVGKFTVTDVACAILPKTLGSATPLLGQSFLRNFSYQIDPHSARLILTKVKTERAAGERQRE
jgi:clan AA aspartic protease (TIGR02281 family)